MVLPVVAYGSSVLRQKAVEVSKDFDVNKLVANLFDTMYNAQGVGIAAPQVGQSVRIFVMDAGQADDAAIPELKIAFINPVIHERFGEKTHHEEGCLSIPGITGDVVRPSSIRMSYYDENWVFHENEIFSDFPARIIQHEYDHIEGILFIDLVSPLRKQLIKGKLNQILRGNTKTSYRMIQM
jgi:peptide deformylase